MMVGVLFLVGAGRETPETVDWLLDVESNPRQPHYDMASELPLVLYDCGFEETRFNYNLREMEDISSTLEGIWHKWVVHATLSRIFIGGILESLKAVCAEPGRGKQQSSNKDSWRCRGRQREHCLRNRRHAVHHGRPW